jgi:hypothetical protein
LRWQQEQWLLRCIAISPASIWILFSDHRGVDSSTLATDTVPKGPGTPGPSLFSSDGGDQ